MQSGNPFDIATCMYYTGIDPRVHVARNLHDRKLQPALMQSFKPENWFLVREALVKAGRKDLVGSGRECLIPEKPPAEAIAAKRKEAQRAEPTYVHAKDAGTRSTVATPATVGYRPGRKGARRR